MHERWRELQIEVDSQALPPAPNTTTTAHDANTFALLALPDRTVRVHANVSGLVERTCVVVFDAGPWVALRPEGAPARF